MPTEVIMPKVDMDMAAGTLAVWHRAEGETVAKGDALFDIETDKATMEVESPATGILHFVAAAPGDEVAIGGNLAWIFAQGEAVVQPATTKTETPAPQTDATSPAPVTQAPPPGTGIRATPLARKIARSLAIDLTSVTGTGPRGRITRVDVEAANQNAASPSVSAQPDAKAIADASGMSYTEIPVDRMRATIAARLTLSKTTIPHFYLQTECALDALLAFRRELNAALKAGGGRPLSINDMLIRACALALSAVPEANASWAGDRIIRYDDAHISVAVALEDGLVTPVVRQAQRKSLQTISTEIADLADRARAGKLPGEAYRGGSFSLSNLGMFGVTSFSAIINPPEAMILAVGKARRHFVPDEDGNPVAATLLSVTLSCDHRVVDGALGARWLQHFQNLIENPLLLTLDPIRTFKSGS